MYQSLSLADRIWLNQEEDFPNLKGRTAGQGAGGCGLLETGSSARSKLIFFNGKFLSPHLIHAINASLSCWVV